jgi:putative membrane protein
MEGNHLKKTLPFLKLNNSNMKKATPLLIAVCSLIFACNDGENADAVDTADSLNEAKIDQSQDAGAASTPVDQETADFFVKAADGGMAEVALGKLAQEKSTNAQVKEFAGMMVTDHTGANSGLKELATKKNVTLPDTVSNDHKEAADKLAKKTGGDFNKDYMDMMVKDHKKTIDLFEKGSNNVKDTEVKSFIDNTLPKLRLHLEAAEKIQKAL